MYSMKAKATGKTYKDVVWLLNYSASYPIAIVRYKASDMILWIHYDSLHLSVSRACSKSCGKQYLSDNSDDQTKNGAINNICKIMGNFMGSEAEFKTGYIYINAKYGFPVKNASSIWGTHNPPPISKFTTTPWKPHPKAPSRKKIKIHRHAFLQAPRQKKLRTSSISFGNQDKTTLAINKPSTITCTPTA